MLDCVTSHHAHCSQNFATTCGRLYPKRNVDPLGRFFTKDTFVTDGRTDGPTESMTTVRTGGLRYMCDATRKTCSCIYTQTDASHRQATDNKNRQYVINLKVILHSVTLWPWPQRQYMPPAVDLQVCSFYNTAAQRYSIYWHKWYRYRYRYRTYLFLCGSSLSDLLCVVVNLEILRHFIQCLLNSLTQPSICTIIINIYRFNTLLIPFCVFVPFNENRLDDGDDDVNLLMTSLYFRLKL